MKTRQIFLPAALAFFFATLAYSAGQPCEPTIPRCPSPPNEGAQCGQGAVLVYGEEQDYEYYHFNGKNSACPNSGGNCNVMVLTHMSGREVSCVSGETTVKYGVCASGLNGTEPLNQKCDLTGPCDSDEPEDEVPSDLIPPYPDPSDLGTKRGIDVPTSTVL